MLTCEHVDSRQHDVPLSPLWGGVGEADRRAPGAVRLLPVALLVPAAAHGGQEGQKTAGAPAGRGVKSGLSNVAIYGCAVRRAMAHLERRRRFGSIPQKRVLRLENVP